MQGIEAKVHVIMKEKGVNPRNRMLCYMLEPEDGDGPWITLHRDNLFPCDFLTR